MKEFNLEDYLVQPISKEEKKSEARKPEQPPKKIKVGADGFIIV